MDGAIKHPQSQEDLAMLKGEFLATVSHELRTPLTSVSSLLELMADDEQADPKLAELVHVLRRNVERLVSTVDELLLLARIEAGQLPFERQPVSPGMLLGELLDPLRAEAADHGVSVRTSSDEAEPAVRVLGDPYWLVRMIRYLVSGSFASGRPSTITVHGEVFDGYWTLTVSGDSLATAAYPLVEAAHESGLGVLLARAIATRHSGQLRIEEGWAPTWTRVSCPVL